LPKKLSLNVEKKLFLIGTTLFWFSLYIYVPILSPYVEHLSGSLALVGAVIGSYGFAQLLFRLPIGIWSDNKGKRKSFILSGFALAFISCVGLALSPNAWFMLLFRWISGIAASMWVVFSVFYSSYFSEKQTARAMSQITFCIGVAQMLGTYSGGRISDAYGWLPPFYIGAGLALLGAVFMLPISERAEKNPAPFSGQKLLAIISCKRLLTVSIITALSQFAMFATTFGFLQIYVTDTAYIGASKTQLGTLMAVMLLCQTISMRLTGAFVAPHIGYKATVGIAYTAIAGVSIITPYISSFRLLFLIQALGALGRGLAYPVLMGLAIQGIPKEEKATAMGFFQAVYAIGMFGGPFSAGFIGGAFGLRSVFFYAGIVYLIASILGAYMLPKRTDVDRQDTTSNPIPQKL